MRKSIRMILTGLACIAALVAGAIWVNREPLLPLPMAPPPKAVAASQIVIDDGQLANGGVLLANQFTGKIGDPRSLTDLKAALAERGPAAMASVEARIATLLRSPDPDKLALPRAWYALSTLCMYEGRFDEAVASIDKALTVGTSGAIPQQNRSHLTAMLGIIALRRGEVENCINCVGPASCIFPIELEAVHTFPAGSRKAIEHFNAYLEMEPGDLRVRWLLNLAYMTLGEYPAKVPSEFFVPLDTFQSAGEMGRFQNVAPLVGLTSRGPNQAGGSVFDDFTGDGLPDLLLTSLDFDRGASFYVNAGNGTFEDRSKISGLDDQIYALNLARADFDNDGHLDVVLLRGGWEKPMRLSLLRNTGSSAFEDVTIASGLAEPIATESAAWGDYDNDGLVDLFVCGEYRPPLPDGGSTPPDARNRCRLYHNEGQGMFVDVASTAGVAEQQCSKGCAWGDYDGDGRLDLFVSNFNAPCRLYHNEANGTFRDVAHEMGIVGPDHPFACWFWDYDNDGLLDLYVNDYSSSLARFVAVSLKMPLKQPSRPRLYRNTGSGGFREVTFEVGLDREMLPMGANFGDVDNDGFLDIYLGTGAMAFEVLVPNLLFKNVAGQRFDDVTMSSGTGHLQKGHGISFADWDCDGDLDFFVEAGGAVPGDRSFNLLFQNPGAFQKSGHGRHWLKVKLVGSKSNRAALGARIKAIVRGADGKERAIYRTVGNNGSFGGNCLVETIGLADATSVTRLEVSWPASQSTQTFDEIAADQAIEITEGNDVFKSLVQPPLPVPRHIPD